MKLEEATEKVVSHPPIKYFVFGVMPNDGNFRLDACACVTEQDLKNELKKFLTARTFELKEITNAH